MTNEEFAVFAKRLFVSFPNLKEWLESASPDPAATQAIWRETLRPYALADCLGIIDDWNTGGREPFQAYERDKVHLIVRSMVGLKLDRQRKRDEVAGRSKEYEQLPNTPFSDVTMADVYKTMLPLYAKMEAGEITVSEYHRIKEVEFAKL